ncbi:Ser/Thr phosphatase family protein [Clostridiales bacterium oral taxon 876 str. F0540]|nr:Ser/Thr phosphatase family protein [Clostridiales bacterium oral taxon 876 str. F0540]
MFLKVLGALIILTIIDIYFETNFTKINRVNIKTKKQLPEQGLKIVQITDYHNFKHNKRILKLINHIKPDIIVITGDLIDKRTKDYSNVYNFVEKLITFNKNVYYVPGNHELRSGNMDRFMKDLEKRRIKVLLNNNEGLIVRHKEINICGIDYSSSKKGNLKQTVSNIDEDLYTILLCHKPDIIKHHKNIPCDLILCGHTHGGQIRIPVVGALIAPDQGFKPKYNKGIYEIGENSLLYIDSGVGTTRLPIRFFNRSQISLIFIEEK